MSLAKLMAAQAAAKAAKESPDASTPPAPATPAQPESKPSEAAAVDNLPDAPKPAPAKGGLAFLKGATKPAPVEAKPEAAVPTQPSSGGTVARGGLAFLKGKPAANASNPASAPNPVPNPVAAPKAPAKDVSEDLSALLDNESPTHRSRFADEIPATGPARELPEGLEAAGKAFIDSLDSIYRVVHEPDLLGGVVKSIMIELQNHPEYRKLIAPQDVHAMVRGMRESMGLARIKKEESKSKRSGTSKKKVQVDDIEVLAALEGMDFS